MLNLKTTQPFNSFPPQILFQEVPDQVSLAFTITGCPLRCPHCHSADTWQASKGQALSDVRFIHYLDSYRGMLSCVLFFGGEWHPEALISKLVIARAQGLNTCLYTGLEHISADIYHHLDYLKTGPWRNALGGLDQVNSNQRFVHLPSGNLLNHRFHRSLDHAAT